MPLFHFNNQNIAQRIVPQTFRLERQLQQIIESNLKEIFGVDFIASEFVIRGEQPGRIDTIGLDQDGAPTIIEYKRSQNENVINQGLYYVNWLNEHRGDFELASQRKLGANQEINWSHIRLIVVAQDYAKYDTYAVKQMGEGIELWRYVLYGEDLLHLELVFGQVRSANRDTVTQKVPAENPALPNEPSSLPSPSAQTGEEVYSLDYHLQYGSELTQSIFKELRNGILALGLEEKEIIETPNKLYIAYRHGRNFCEIEIQRRAIKVTLDAPLSILNDPQGLARDVTNVGHWGTGTAQFKLDSPDEIEYALGLIAQSYHQTK